MTDLVQSVVNLGFAVAVGSYLIWWITEKLNSKLDKLVLEIEKLNDNIDRILRVIKNE